MPDRFHRADPVSDPLATVGRMMIDCGQCAVRGDSCADCVVTFLSIGVRGDAAAPAAARTADLDTAERGALAVLADHGLVPPLRLRTG